MSETQRPPPKPMDFLANLVGGLLRLPDVRGACEGLLLFLLVLAGGAWAWKLGALHFHPMVDRHAMGMISFIAFFVPGMSEEVAFRGWLGPRDYFPAAISLILFVAWHPFQMLIHSPFAEPVFADWRYLVFVAWLGLCCTLSRMRSGSVWPSVIIHWGVVVIWKALFDS